jgi:hypothetical protein
VITLEEIAIMHKPLAFVLVTSIAVAVAVGAAPGKAQAGQQLPEGFVPLFNGKDFTGWHGLETMDPRKTLAGRGWRDR